MSRNATRRVLLEPVRIGSLELPNRIVMAPLTRSRAVDDRTPNELMVEYYRQRASAGMILSEATAVCPMGVGYANTPGIWSAAQIAGWRRVTAAVHAAGGRMLLQLWHVGRVSDPIHLDGQLPVAPSAIALAGTVTGVRPKRPWVTPRALASDEIPGIVAAFRDGAENARTAGFDGVEVHGANGYLLDQFLHDGSNRRTDRYGGSIENRVRLLLEVTDSVVEVWGAGRVGVHLAPRGDYSSMHDSDPAALFGHVAAELGRRGIAFLCVRESLEGGPRLGPQLAKTFGGAYIANEAFTQETAERTIAAGEATAVAFGRLFIANPDLPRRFAEDAPLNTPNSDTFNTTGAEGLIDYPALPEP